MHFYVPLSHTVRDHVVNYNSFIIMIGFFFGERKMIKVKR